MKWFRMSRWIFLSIVIFIGFSSFVIAQEKVEAPVWNVGDKWVFNLGTVEVLAADENNYTVKFSGSTLIEEATVIYERSTFKITQILEGKRKQKYRGTKSSILNFPLSPGKTWKDNSTGRRPGATAGDGDRQVLEKLHVLGWEDVEVKAGKFKTIKLEYKQHVITGGRPLEAGAWCWYSPDVKYLVKWRWIEGTPTNTGWELVSFDLEK